MSRIITSNYGADPTTQFAWATAGTDQFSRTQDLYYLAQAVELHDHTAGRGLPVGRINSGIIDSTALAPQSVTTAALANLSVTNPKLAAGAVSMDKITMPLREATSDAAGGIQLRDAGNAYTTNWWTSANGFLVLGATTTARILIDQGNHVAIGSQFPATVSLFNIFQTGTTIQDGFRITHPSNDAHRFAIYVDASAQVWLATPTTGVILGASIASFYPGIDNAVTLGNGSFRWSTIYAINANIGGTTALTTVTMSTLSGSSISITGNLFVGGTITGPSNISTSNLATTTMTFSSMSGTSISISGNITAGSFTSTGVLTAGSVAVTGGGAISGAGSVTASGAGNFGSVEANTGTIHGGDLNINATGYFGTTLRVAYGTTPPPWNITLGSGDAGKPGGGPWQSVSDPRAKYKDSIREYTSGLEAALVLEPIWFRYNGKYGMPDDGRDYVGFDASALKSLVPSMVREIQAYEDTNAALGEDSQPDVILSVDSTEMPFIAIRAIQELHGMIQELQNRVQALEHS
jgi:hypothetical protein